MIVDLTIRPEARDRLGLHTLTDVPLADLDDVLDRWGLTHGDIAAVANKE